MTRVVLDFERLCKMKVVVRRHFDAERIGGVAVQADEAAMTAVGATQNIEYLQRWYAWATDLIGTNDQQTLRIARFIIASLPPTSVFLPVTLRRDESLLHKAPISGSTSSRAPWRCLIPRNTCWAPSWSWRACQTPRAMADKRIWRAIYGLASRSRSCDRHFFGYLLQQSALHRRRRLADL